MDIHLRANLSRQIKIKVLCCLFVFAFICSLERWVHAIHGTCMEVNGQLWGVSPASAIYVSGLELGSLGLVLIAHWATGSQVLILVFTTFNVNVVLGSGWNELLQCGSLAYALDSNYVVTAYKVTGLHH